MQQNHAGIPIAPVTGCLAQQGISKNQNQQNQTGRTSADASVRLSITMTQTRKDRIGSPPEAIDADITIMDDVQDTFHSVYGRVTYLEWCNKEAQRIGARVRHVGEWCCVTGLV